MLSNEIEDFLSNFRSRSHIALFYHSPESKREILFTHLEYGKRYQGLSYVCSEESPEQIRKGMIDFGLDPDRLRADRRLTIENYDDIYIVNGRVNNSHIMTKFSDMVSKYREMGLDGLRASAEMSCFVREGRIKELTLYEYALHRKYKFAAEGICAYNIQELQKTGHLETVMPMIRAHDTVILSGPHQNVLLDPMKTEDEDVQEVMSVDI